MMVISVFVFHGTTTVDKTTFDVTFNNKGSGGPSQELK
jgi:hypothetical protein